MSSYSLDLCGRLALETKNCIERGAVCKGRMHKGVYLVLSVRRSDESEIVQLSLEGLGIVVLVVAAQDAGIFELGRVTNNLCAVR